MTIPENIDFFNKFSVAVPSFIRHPTLRKLAERVQHETLNALTSPAMYESGNTSQSTRILDSLLLLTRRAAHMNSHAGEVSCVGGKHDRGDGNNVVTALREACEETALPPNKVQLLGQLPIQTSKSGMSVRPIVALIAPGLVLVPEAGEISRIFWADLESLVTQPTVEYEIEYKMQEQMATMLTPSWQVDGETVWGLTGRVIANLLETGFDRQLEWYYRVENKR